jgi:hypothetical protein
LQHFLGGIDAINQTKPNQTFQHSLKGMNQIVTTLVEEFEPSNIMHESNETGPGKTTLESSKTTHEPGKTTHESKEPKTTLGSDRAFSNNRSSKPVII